MAQLFTDFTGGLALNIPGMAVVDTSHRVFADGEKINLLRLVNDYAMGTRIYTKESFSGRVNLYMKAINRGTYAGSADFANSGVNLIARASHNDGTAVAAPNYNHVKTGFAHRSGSAFGRQRVNGSSAGLNASFSGTYQNPFVATLDRTLHYRGDFNAGTIRCKNWIDGNSEPSYGGNLTTTVTAAGYVGFAIPCGNCLYEVLAFGIGTDGDDAPTSPIVRTVSGIVQGMLERDILVYAQETGALLGKTRSDALGNFSFNITNSFITSVRVVCVDEGAEPKNSLIYDRVLPV